MLAPEKRKILSGSEAICGFRAVPQRRARFQTDSESSIRESAEPTPDKSRLSERVAPFPEGFAARQNRFPPANKARARL